MADRIRQISELGQAIWIDFISRNMLHTGELRALVDAGVTGMTSNPTIFQKAISKGSEYDDQLRELARSQRSAYEIYEALAKQDVQHAADQLLRVYNETSGKDGYVSMEVDPQLAADTDKTIEQARRLWSELDRPNVMIKVPATPEGIPAIETLITDGINVNVTLIFGIDAYEQVMGAYLGGLQARREAGKPLRNIASVASFFVSRVDTLVDSLLAEKAHESITGLESLRGQAAISNAKIAYDRFQTKFGGADFADLSAAGARVQRPLWASTSTKNPNYPDTKYVDNLIGPDTVNTLPPNTLEALRDHSNPARTIDLDLEDAYAVIERLGAVDIHMNAVTNKLLADGVQAFADSFAQLIQDVEAKVAKLSG